MLFLWSASQPLQSQHCLAARYSISLPHLLAILGSHLSIKPSIHRAIHPSVHQSIHSSCHPSISPSIHRAVHPSISTSIHRAIRTSISPSILCAFHPSISPSIHRAIHPSIHQFTQPFACPPITLKVHLWTVIRLSIRSIHLEIHLLPILCILSSFLLLNRQKCFSVNRLIDVAFPIDASIYPVIHALPHLSIQSSMHTLIHLSSHPCTPSFNIPVIHALPHPSFQSSMHSLIRHSIYR